MTIYFLTIYFPNGPSRLRAREADWCSVQEGFLHQIGNVCEFCELFLQKCNSFWRIKAIEEKKTICTIGCGNSVKMTKRY